MEWDAIVLYVLPVYAIAVACKGALAITSGRAYTFSMWDGGLLRAGKSLSPFGTKLKIVTATGILVTSVLVTTGVVRVVPGLYYVAAAAIIGVVCDLSFPARDTQ